MIDWLVHHAEILSLKGDSYRPKKPPPRHPARQTDLTREPRRPQG
jgi:hypothetical protein